jgi:hypothetical protein
MLKEAIIFLLAQTYVVGSRENTSLPCGVCTSHWKPNWSGLFNHAYLLRNLEEAEMQVFRHNDNFCARWPVIFSHF